jgi:DNA replication protein DnaC
MVKKFNILSKNLFLTYSHVTNLIAQDEILEQLKRQLKNNILYYLIAKEKHDDNVNIHYHVYLELVKRIHITSPKKLDLIDMNGNKIHGNYQSVKDVAKLLSYIIKDDSYITNLTVNESIKKMSKMENDLKFVKSSDKSLDSKLFNSKLVEIASKSSVKEAMKYFSSERPDLVTSRYSSILNNLNKYMNCDNSMFTAKPTYLLSDYEYPERLINWFEKEKEEKSLFLIGPSGCGKTEAMITLLSDLNPFLVKEINILKDFTEENKAILFDDTSGLNELSREDKLNLLTIPRPTVTRIMYQTVSLPAKLPRIFISNNMDFFDLPGNPINSKKSKLITNEKIVNEKIANEKISEELYSLLRRVTIVKIKEPLYKKEIGKDLTVKISTDGNENLSILREK